MTASCHEGTSLDQGVAPNTATLLRAAGWDVIHVMEVDLSRADDAGIVEYTRRNDFHLHPAMTRADGPSVILIRAEGLQSPGQVELIKQVYAFCGDAIESGAAVSVDKSAVRMRRLPLA